MTVAKEIGVDAARAADLSQPDGICTLKGLKMEGFSLCTVVFCFIPDQLAWWPVTGR